MSASQAAQSAASARLVTAAGLRSQTQTLAWPAHLQAGSPLLRGMFRSSWPTHLDLHGTSLSRCAATPDVFLFHICAAPASSTSVAAPTSSTFAHPAHL
ncbi:hypothetical protein GQ55_5G366300 [Panicum hallii var. hallii]|uniref:Uncharacterized protein n=1 Tax=Panicum hallii var. hallii TaxID=1504633 RepID=A0A2T7DMK4_9POAL|nr:hypothetical protein GQ55_5G366300 [Panicum hallii var. hallii]